MGVEETSWINE